MPNEFTPAPEELQRLAEEISLLRRDFQSGFAALGRIEKRIKAAFPDYAPKKEARPAASAESRPASSKDRDALMKDFDSLVTMTRQKGDAGFESFLSSLPEQDVIALAHELGVGSLKKASFKKARDGIRKRTQEALMLNFEAKKPAEGGSSPG